MICNAPCRIVQFITNFLTLLVGLALVALGGVMTWGKSVMNNILHNFLQDLLNAISPKIDAAAYTEAISRILHIISPVGIAVFTFGCVITVVSLIGYIGACTDAKMINYVYEIILASLAIIVVVVVLVYFLRKNQVAKYAETAFAESVKKYRSMQTQDVHALLVGLISPMLNCCGVHNGSDFESMMSWDIYDGKNYTDLDYPVICCKMDHSYRIIDDHCPRNFTIENSNVFNGCEQPLRTYFLKYMDYVAIGMIGALGILLILITSTAFMVCCDFI